MNIADALFSRTFDEGSVIIKQVSFLFPLILNFCRRKKNNNQKNKNTQMSLNYLCPLNYLYQIMHWHWVLVNKICLWNKALIFLQVRKQIEENKWLESCCLSVYIDIPGCFHKINAVNPILVVLYNLNTCIC